MSGETKLSSFVGGVGIGITASTLSAITGAAGLPMGYSPIGLKNLLKVGLTTGVSSLTVFMLHDKVIEMIRKKLLIPSERFTKKQNRVLSYANSD